MSRPTVGQLRAAIEGLPDDATVFLLATSPEDEPGAFITIERFLRVDDQLWIEVLAEPIDDEGDDES